MLLLNLGSGALNGKILDKELLKLSLRCVLAYSMPLCGAINLRGPILIPFLIMRDKITSTEPNLTEMSINFIIFNIPYRQHFTLKCT